MKPRVLILVGLLAFAARAIYVFEMRACPFFEHPAIDAETYLTQAAAIAGGDLLGRGAAFYGRIPYWQPPGYQYFLAIFVYLFGLKYTLLHLVGALVGAGTAVATTLLANRVFGKRAAVVAGVVTALYAPLILYDGEFLSVGLFTFTLMILLRLAVGNRQSYGRWFLIGVVNGIGAIILPTVLIVSPLLAAWAIIRNGSGRKGVALAALLTLGTILTIAPVTIRNRVIGKEWALISTNAGMNFYIGNHPTESFALQRIRPGRQWDRLISAPDEAGARGMTGRNNWFFRVAFRAIERDPAGWLKLKAKGVGIFFNGHEVLRNQDPYFFREYSRLLWALLWEKGISFPLGLIWPLAILGMIAALGKSAPTDKSAAKFLIAFVAFYGTAVVIFFVTGRYTLPTIPVLIAFAAYGVVRSWDVVAAHDWKRTGIGAAVFLVALIFCNLPYFRVDLCQPGENEFYLARIYYDEGQYDKAKREYILSLKKWGDNVDAIMEVGNLFTNVEQNPPEAVLWYDRAIQLDPLFEKAYYNRGLALSRMGLFEEAAVSFKKAIQLDPHYSEPRDSLRKIQKYLNPKDAPVHQ